MAKIAGLLVVARTRAGLTQRGLSAAAGIPQASVSLIERGLIAPRTSTVERWLEACGATLRLEEQPETSPGLVAASVPARRPGRHRKANQRSSEERRGLDWASWMS
jgi:transcriptional regulator with XRE-family HTH domain